MTEQRLPTVNGDDGAWGDILNQFMAKEHYNTGVDNAANGGHKTVTLQPGTNVAGTAPLKFTSGSLLTAPEVGAIEFSVDKLYYTQTSAATRRVIAAYDDSGGAKGDIYYRNNSGSSGSFTSLAVGADTYVLTASGGLPTWAAPSTGGSGLTQQQVMGISSMRI